MIILNIIIFCSVSDLTLSYNLDLDSKQRVILHPKPIKVPEIYFFDSNNAQIYLQNFENQIVLVNFWATWCTFCTNKMTSLERLQREFKSYPFKILPVSIDFKSIDIVKEFYKKKNIKSLEIYIDPKAKSMKTLNIMNVPAAILINQYGREIMRVYGVVDWDNDTNIRKIIIDKLNHMQNIEVEEDR